MGKDQEESDNPDEKIGIRTRIRDKFKTIAAETKAIKERNHALAISLSSSFSKHKFHKTLLILLSIFSLKIFF